MPDSSPPSHLPGPFPDVAAYDLAYEFVRNVRDVYHGGPTTGRRRASRPACPLRRSTGRCRPPTTSNTAAT